MHAFPLAFGEPAGSAVASPVFAALIRSRRQPGTSSPDTQTCGRFSYAASMVMTPRTWLLGFNSNLGAGIFITVSIAASLSNTT